jgi:TPR repeat protein
MKKTPSTKVTLVRGLFLLLVLHSTAIQIAAQQTEVDRKLVAEIRAMAENGDAQSQDKLGRALCFGNLGLAKDQVEAVKWFHKAAEQNYGAAQYTLANCYFWGRGVAQDEAEAVRWYRRTGEQNHGVSQFAIGDCCLTLGNCYVDGLGVTQDYVEAVKWYRKAAELNDAAGPFGAAAQFRLGVSYELGRGVAKDAVEAVKWYLKAAEQNLAEAQFNLGNCYANGKGVTKDQVEAVKCYRKAAEQNYAVAQNSLGVSYYLGRGVTKDPVEAVKWYRKAAEQNYAMAQFNLGGCYQLGEGLVKDEIQAYKWFLLAGSLGEENGKAGMAVSEKRLTREQIAEGQKLARNFKPHNVSPADSVSLSEGIADPQPSASGTGFFITEDGYLITNEHVVKDAMKVRVVTSSGLIAAKVVKVDAANDLALLKADRRLGALPVAASRGVKLGGTVATVGFPNIGLQGFAPKLAKGEIASLSGAGDDARYFQISVPVQPGNSGGALVDDRGNVVGVVSAKLSAKAALAASGSLPENVNYAVKSSYLLSFLESVPEVSAKLKEPETKERKFEDVVKSAEQEAVLVLVY